MVMKERVTHLRRERVSQESGVPLQGSGRGVRECRLPPTLWRSIGGRPPLTLVKLTSLVKLFSNFCCFTIYELRCRWNVRSDLGGMGGAMAPSFCSFCFIIMLCFIFTCDNWCE